MQDQGGDATDSPSVNVIPCSSRRSASGVDGGQGAAEEACENRGLQVAERQKQSDRCRLGTYQLLRSTICLIGRLASGRHICRCEVCRDHNGLIEDSAISWRELASVARNTKRDGLILATLVGATLNPRGVRRSAFPRHIRAWPKESSSPRPSSLTFTHENIIYLTTCSSAGSLLYQRSLSLFARPGAPASHCVSGILRHTS